jgi:hypothetical protein
MTPIERQAERAMHRINEATNRSAGQHMRAIRKSYAQSVIEPAEPEPTRPDAIAECHEVDTGPESGIAMLAYLLVAVVATAAAIALSLFITQ